MKIAKLDKKDQIIERLNQEIERLERQIDEQAKLIAAQSERLAILEPLEAKVVELEKTIEYLKAQLGRNSSDSSLPPSRDMKAPKPSPKSLRTKSNRKAGGQKGHKGSHIELPHEPNEYVQHWPTECMTCPKFAECAQNAKVQSSRHVIKPRLEVDVIEHQRMEMLRCPSGKKRLTGTFPGKLKAPVQYKERNIAKDLDHVSAYHLKKFDQMYADIIALAHQECPAAPPPPKNSIEVKKELPLIKRLEILKSSATLFVRNFSVPFDNNEAERAIRCVRIKTKSAGGFRGTGGEDYCTLMSYINTAWKHGVNAFKALSEAFVGNFQVIFGEPCHGN